MGLLGSSGCILVGSFCDIISRYVELERIDRASLEKPTEGKFMTTQPIKKDESNVG